MEYAKPTILKVMGGVYFLCFKDFSIKVTADEIIQEKNPIFLINAEEVHFDEYIDFFLSCHALKENYDLDYLTLIESIWGNC